MQAEPGRTAREAGLVLDRVSARTGGHPVLAGVSLEVPPGRLLALLGGRAAGKSTLLGILAGLAAPSAGAVFRAGTDLRRTPPHRRGFGVVAQQDALFPRLTLAQNIAYPLLLRQVRRRDRVRLVEAACDSVFLGGAHRLPHQASAAECQRAWIARATVFGPAVLLLDDPLGLQAQEERPRLLAALRRLHLMLGSTTVLATRVPGEAFALADHLAVLARGQVVQAGAPEPVYERPASAMAALACGEANLLPGTVRAIDEDGIARVTLACGPVVEGMAGQTLRVRDACLFCLRPERIALAPAQASEMGEAALDAAVLEVLHLGDTVRLSLLLGAGQEVVVKRPAAAGLRGMRRGESVAIAWQPHHATVFPGTG